MLKLKLNHERLADRKRLSGLLPGRMQRVGSPNYITGRAVDVSSQGIGILSQNFLREGDEVILTTRHHVTHLVVHYKKRDYKKNNRYRYGLILAKNHEQDDHDLIKIFDQSGCFH